MADDISRFDTSPQPLTIQYARRSVLMLTVSKEELYSVSGLGGSLYLAFFGICWEHLFRLPSCSRLLPSLARSHLRPTLHSPEFP